MNKTLCAAAVHGTQKFQKKKKKKKQFFARQMPNMPIPMPMPELSGHLIFVEKVTIHLEVNKACAQRAVFL